MTRSTDHPYYLKIEQAIKPHLYKYEEPWLNRDPMIQDILDALFREPYSVTAVSYTHLTMPTILLV